MTHLLVALLLASNASGKTLVRQQQGTIVPVAGYPGPLILEDANTVIHDVWNGTAMVPLVGPAWTMNGTVPQVAKSGKTPAGSGPYSDANYYSLGTGSDVLDFAGDFSFCIIFNVSGTDLSGGKVLFSNGTFNTNGWFIQGASATTMRLSVSASAANVTSTPTTSVAGTLSVFCGGRAGTNQFAKANLGTATSPVATTAITPATATPARIGAYTVTGFFPSGVIYEFWCSTTTPTDALFTAIMQRVKTRAGVTAW